MTEIAYVLPNLGFIKLKLFPPADQIYASLVQTGEVARLAKLSHIGALAEALPGIHRTRWDYTVSMLYFIGKLYVSGLNCTLRLGRMQFSSGIACLQSLALLWNIGHLPGTFAVEKGVARHLFHVSPNSPVDGLSWPAIAGWSVDPMKQAANTAFLEDDFLMLSRILAILKLLSYVTQANDPAHLWATDLYGPFVFPILRTDKFAQWQKVSWFFDIVRHVAYLNLDAPLSGIPWGFDFGSVAAFMGSDRFSAQAAQELREVLSPIERSVYANLYHRAEARLSSAAVAHHVHGSLQTSPNASLAISQWLHADSLAAVHGHTYTNALTLGGSAKIRSHLTKPKQSIVSYETSLSRHSDRVPLVLKYRSWNVDKLFETDEWIIESYTNGQCSPEDQGNMITWFMQNIDDLNYSHKDVMQVLRAIDLQPTYLDLFRQAVTVAWPGTTVRFDAWPLREFGLFNIASAPLFSAEVGAVWPANSRLSSPVIRHILRIHNTGIPPAIQDTYAELQGLSALRTWIRHSDQRLHKRLREKWLVFSGSVVFMRGGQDLIEFDGGMLHISSRSGRLTFYAVETKSGRAHPNTVLARNLGNAGIAHAGTTLLPGNWTAFVKIPVVRAL